MPLAGGEGGEGVGPRPDLQGAGGRSPSLMYRGGIGVRYHVTYPMMHLVLPTLHKQRDACENITFKQLRLRAVKKHNRTRMHSSRMRTVCCSDRLLGGCLPGGCLSGQRGMSARGEGYLPSLPGRVSA